MLSTSSDITDTSFAFDQEALNSNIYRQAFKQRMQNLVSLPMKSRGDRASVYAIASLSEDASYYDETIQTLKETTMSGSAEPVVPMEIANDLATQDDGIFNMKKHRSFGKVIPEDHVLPENELLHES